jgi:hypothetical protein
MRLLQAIAALELVTTAAAAQQPPQTPAHEGHHDMAVPGGGSLPPGWSARTDDEGQMAGVKLETMAPGWHLTMGTSAILYREADAAVTPYRVVSKLHLFPGTGDHTEAFGLFIGGKDLSGAGQRYTYFIMRGDGTWKIKRRQGATASDVTGDWKPSSAIHQSTPSGPVANTIAIVVQKDSVHFLVNEQQVYAAAAGSVDTDGIVGLRMNHNLSVHVETFETHKM